ncbi:MAG: hypothetical protein AAF975_09655, partial [Spirochaetota bacterium]
MGPFISGYFASEKYHMAELSRMDQELEAKHQSIWGDLEFSWRQFWINKVSARLINFYSFWDELGPRLQENSRPDWKTEDFLDFYNRFLKGYLGGDTVRENVGAGAYYYLIDSAGNVRQSVPAWQPSWKEYGDLKSLDVLLSLGYDISQTLKTQKGDTGFYLEYNAHLGIDPKTNNTILT